jgi:hypothetical protein
MLKLRTSSPSQLRSRRSGARGFRLLIGLLTGSFLLATACRSEETDAGVSHPDAKTSGADGGAPVDVGGGGTQDGGGGTSDAGGGGGFTTLTVAQVIQMRTMTRNVQIEHAVVVGENHYMDAMTGGTIGTFYLQDPAMPGAGVAVFHGKNDAAPYPTVGAIVTVKGYITVFDGVLEIESHNNSSTGETIALDITIEQASGGTAMGGAYPPAGNPTEVASVTGYEHTTMNAHPEQVGNVLHFAGPLSVVAGAGPVQTDRDGGTRPKGFEVTGGLWIDDNFVYKNCIAPLDGGMLNLQSGIKGVWDRYQDFYAGTSMNPAPAVPVLFPTTCADLGL